LPLPRIAKAATDAEKDILERFFEAAELREGRTYVSELREQPRGRYARVAPRIDLASYRAAEVAAFNWIWGELSAEWRGVAVVFIQQMREQSQYTVIDWGKFLIDEDNEDAARGGAIVSYRLLAVTLKNAYSRFAQWYRMQEDARNNGRAITEKQATDRLSRADLVAPRIRQIAERTRQSGTPRTAGS
jgi:hypothetical protein